MTFLDEFFKKHKKSKVVSLTVEDIDKLPTFSDVDLGLYWNRITKDNLLENEHYFQEMSEWANNAGIQRYISSSIPVNELFHSYVGEGSSETIDKCNLYFCFNDNKDFIGVVYISAPFGLNKDSTIEYLVVNPKFQRSGLGTKMIKSISTYTSYFNNGYASEGIVTSVESENLSSSRVFLKNNYKVVSTNWSDAGRHYKVLYLSSRNNVKQDIDLVG